MVPVYVYISKLVLMMAILMGDNRCTVAQSDFGASLIVETTLLPESCNSSAAKTANGDMITVHYIGTIDESSETGVKKKEFDNSFKLRKPFKFALGRGQVIPGWDQGLLNMCMGENRTLIVPPALGYGAGGNVPGGATLRFNIRCIKIGKQWQKPNVFQEMDLDNDFKITYEEFEAYFLKTTNALPPPTVWAKEDKNQDKYISWDEFSGPKGDIPDL